DNDYPFFVYSKYELCKNGHCQRQMTLEIPKGETRSKSLYLIVKRSRGKESLKFNVDPNMVFSGHNYAGINKDKTNPDLSISKSADRVDSPWSAGRFLMLTSDVEVFDC